MDVEGINLDFKGASNLPPIMPWREFANWIRMHNDHDTVRGWMRQGYIPHRKVGRHVMVNVVLFVHRLLEQD